jgi:hypothetical protein
VTHHNANWHNEKIKTPNITILPNIYCRIQCVVMMSVVMLSADMLFVIMPCVIMLRVVYDKSPVFNVRLSVIRLNVVVL